MFIRLYDQTIYPLSLVQGFNQQNGTGGEVLIQVKLSGKWVVACRCKDGESATATMTYIMTVPAEQSIDLFAYNNVHP